MTTCLLQRAPACTALTHPTYLVSLQNHDLNVLFPASVWLIAQTGKERQGMAILELQGVCVCVCVLACQSLAASFQIGLSSFTERPVFIWSSRENGVAECQPVVCVCVCASGLYMSLLFVSYCPSAVSL